jgi:cytochrome P450
MSSGSDASHGQQNDRAERLRRSNREIWQEWAIDPHQDPYSIPVEKLNPGHPALFEANTVLPYFERMRREAPVHWCEDSPFGPYWSVTKWQDILQVDTSHEIYSSDIRNGGIQLGGRPDPNPDPLTHLPMFIMEDPPKHTEQRGVVAPVFGKAEVLSLESEIRERASRILDGLPRNEEFNWVREVSVELTGQMLAVLFDVPQEDRHKLTWWSDVTQSIGDPDVFETAEDGFRELWKCWEYFDAVWKERAQRKEPGRDLISVLVHGEATRNMPPNEYLGNVLLLIVGGNDTTRNSISGGVLALNQFPEEYDKLLANPDVIPNMVSEFIRFQSPVAHMARTALQDTELGGQHIRAGDKVAMWYISGNRDDDHFSDPDRLQIDRRNARTHVAFGYGIHRCIGNRLGEMQLRVLWEEIVKRFGSKKIEVVGEPKYLRSSFIRGIRELPVRIRA